MFIPSILDKRIRSNEMESMIGCREMSKQTDIVINVVLAFVFSGNVFYWFYSTSLRITKMGNHSNSHDDSSNNGRNHQINEINEVLNKIPEDLLPPILQTCQSVFQYWNCDHNAAVTIVVFPSGFLDAEAEPMLNIHTLQQHLFSSMSLVINLF